LPAAKLAETSSRIVGLTTLDARRSVSGARFSPILLRVGAVV